MNQIDILMTRFLGVNWVTTLFGWIAILACSIHFDPSLASFLPEVVARYVVGFSGWIAIISGGIMVTKVKDSRVTGGIKPATSEAENRITLSSDSSNSSTPSTLLKVAALGLFLFGAQGCSTVQNFEVSDALPFVRPAVSLACAGVLNLALDGQDRIDKANMVYAVAHAVRSLSGGTVPTPSELSDVIDLWMPDKSHWSKLSTTISGVYSGAFSKLQGNPLLAVQILEQIALGCEDSARAITKGGS